jgi:hypothetical protein
MKTQLSKPARSKARYTEEYKQEALELWRASGRSAAKVAAELGIRAPLLYRWGLRNRSPNSRIQALISIVTEDEISVSCQFGRWIVSVFPFFWSVCNPMTILVLDGRAYLVFLRYPRESSMIQCLSGHWLPINDQLVLPKFDRFPGQSHALASEQRRGHRVELSIPFLLS